VASPAVGTRQSESATRYDLLLKREKIYDLLGQREEQKQDLSALIALAEQLDDNQRRAEVSIRRSCYGERISDYSTALSAARSAILFAQQAADQKLLAKGHLQWGQALWPQGEYQTAQEHFLEALSLYRAVGCQRGEGNTLMQLGLISIVQGDYATAKRYLEQALTIRRATLDQRGEGATLINLGAGADSVGQYAQAKQYQQQALSIMRKVGDRLGESVVLANLAFIDHHLENDQRAIDYCQQVLKITQEIGNPYFYAGALTVLAHAQVALGELDQAIYAYQQALMWWQQMQNSHNAMDVLAGLGRISLLQGQLLPAQEYITQILSHLEEHSILESTFEPIRVYLTCYQVLQANQDARAKKTLQQAHDLLQKRAAKISDEAMRHLFLTNIAAHREIVAEWQKTQE
ncbi:MAG: tetratricopeptide repeat protein, partial [Ardenticatenaceae bacterium]